MKRKFFAVLWLAGLALTAAKYPPGLHWREIERNGITIVFPAGRSAEAEAALTAAESLSGKVGDFLWEELPGRVRIILSDSTDQANGFATFFPFNLVEVDLAEPPPDSELAGSRSWIELVLAHELTHVFTLNSAPEPFRKLRRAFGSLPALYPAVQMPPWVIEGLAVYGESALTSDGRLNHPPYRLMLDAARRDGMLPDWSRIAGMPAAWPGPSAKYLFGAGFMEFLAEKYEADRLRIYLSKATSRLVLFSSDRDFRRTFGEPLGKLWGEYRDRVSTAVKLEPEPLTKNGFLQQYPCPLGEDKLIYYRRGYRGRGEVAILDLKTGQDKALFKMDAVNGLSVAEDGKKILLSAVDNFHAFSEFSDLYEYDLGKRKLKRLSRGQRLLQPEKKEISGEVYCVQRRDGRYYLSGFDTQTGRSQVLSRPFAGMAQPAVNPNGQMIAAAVKSEGGPWGIAFFWHNGEIGRFISVPGSNLSQPRWLSDANLLFISSGKESSCLASYNLAENPSEPCPGGPCSSVDDPRLAGLQQFAISDKGWDIFFTYHSSRGQEIAKLNLESVHLSPLEISITSGIPEAPAAPAPPASRPYRPWRDLLPHYWSTAMRSSGDEIQAGIATGGQDALGIHSYSLEGYYGFSSHRPNILFRYAYDGLFPTLSFAYSDSAEYYRGSRDSLRTRELKLASLWPLRLRKRSQLYAYADLHLEKRSHIEERGEFNIAESFNGFRLGLSFNSAREYYDSVSPSDGMHLSLQGFIHPEGIGNKWANRGVQADVRGYIPLFRPGVLAWRLAAARSWDAGDSYYTMGGSTAEGGPGSSHPFKLLRGLDEEYYRGDRGWQFNLEYRLPLFRIEKAVLPAVSLDRIWLNAFFDMGRLATGYYSHPAAYSTGAELVLRLAFGGVAAYDLAFGSALGFGPEDHYYIYLRTGRSF